MMIQSGELKPGDKVITEGELCACLHISRTTVRLAVRTTDLRRPHRSLSWAWFLHRQPQTAPASKLSLQFHRKHAGTRVIPTSRILTASVENAIEPIRTKLKLPANQSTVFHLRRLRCADDEPILLEDTFIPYYLCNGIEAIDFSKNSLYQILSQRYSLNLYHAAETIEAIVLGKVETAQLECRVKTAGYRITRVSNLDSGYPFEFTQSITKADRCVFQLELYKNNNAVKNIINFQRQVQL